MKKSTINIEVTTDINHLPEKIMWEASDSGMEGQFESKSIMLALWDPMQKNTLKIDLWTKDMTIDEMKLFFYQTMMSMSATLERATNETDAANAMRKFCDEFAQNLISYPVKENSGFSEFCSSGQIASN